ncbi:MAG: NADH-quinone oxidoreductase subunit NuoN [Gammaproteobacteria bacterium]|nr:NADH-quinone oxidoreductase subunit NuoN [Gammaproteobacteria bacterium]
MQYTPSHFVALLPLLIVGVTAIVVMLAIAWRRKHDLTFILTAIGLNLALLSLIPALQVTPLAFTELMQIDRFALLYMGLILVATLACTTLVHAYLGKSNTGEGFPGNREEMYLLMLLAAAGGLVMVGASHLATLFIGLELLSVPVYGMVAYAFFNKRSLEAGIKYMVLSAAGSAFLLFGMALAYAESGSLQFAALGAVAVTPILQIGFAMMLIGLAFKLSLVPFHLWTPDVYEGAPAPVSAFLATAAKVAVFAVLLRLYQVSPATSGGWLNDLLAAIAIASILFGNLLALMQSNLKRLLGYSSIAHFGYLVIALIATDGLAIEAVGVYLVTYVLTTLGAFGVVTLMSTPFKGRDADALYQYRGLFWRRPYLTAVLATMMLSLAGIPLTAGFIGKFFIIAAGVESQLWWLLGALIMGSAIGLYYYLRVMVTLFLVEPGIRRRDAPLNWGQHAGGIMLLLMALLVFVLGVYPQPLLELVQQATLAAG